MRRIEEEGQMKLRQVVLMRDDTAQRRAEKLARIMLDEMLQFVGLLTPDGIMLEVNRSAAEGGGQRAEDLLGKPFWEAHWWATGASTREQLRDAIRRAASGEHVRYDVEVLGGAAGSQTIIIDFSISPVRDEDGKVVFLLPEGRDITEKRRAEAEIASKNRELEALVARVQDLDATRSRFFANISHELRTPLTLILDPVATLLRADNLDAEQRALLGVVQRNAAQLLRRVQELLDISKLDAQQMTLSCAPLDLAQLARACAANFSALAEQRAISIQIDAPPLVVHADGDKIERILLNLLANALRFTPPAGRLHIALSLVDGVPTLSVEDSGPGVPDDMRERIFERFQQGDHQHGGTGLGLTIARDMATLHGGSLVAEPCEYGARFVLRLPADRVLRCHDAPDHKIPDHAGLAEQAALQLLAQPRVARVAGDAQAPLVLVVEDSPELGDVLVDCLASDHRVMLVPEGLAALDALREAAPVCIVTDLMMPGLGGADLLELLAAQDRLPPALVLSARADDPLRESLLARGLAQDYMHKPFSRAELRARVSRLVERQLDLLRLREREAQLDEAQALGGMGSWDWYPKTGRLNWSRNHFRLHGLEPGAVEPSFDLFMHSVHPEDRPRVLASIERTLADDTPYDLQMRMARADGAHRVFQARGVLVRDERGEPARLFGTVQDVTELREAEQRLRASLDDKEVLLREIHHRVKNNLQVISSLLSLQAARLDDALARDILEQMQGRVRAIGALHAQLYQGTSFAAIHADQYLHDLVDLVGRSMGRAPGQHIEVAPCALELRLEEAVPCALILNELLSNAIKYSGPTATIRVSLSSDGAHAQLCVFDDGPGYPPDLDPARTRTMGLNLVRTLARQLGGVVEHPPHQGARCVVRFPIPARSQEHT